MKSFKLAALTAAAVVMWSAPALGQSPLAAAARREAARREAVKAASIPVYTNADLAKLPSRSAPPIAPRLPAVPATEVTTAGVGGDTAPAAPAAPAAADPKRDEKYWHERITSARSDLARAKLFAEALQTRINSLGTDYINRDDPAQRQQIFEDRQRALEELSRVQEEIASLTQAIADIEEEARRLSVPPGWLR
jgi:hypothetical protein